jgi:hypothetical protein
MPPSSWTALLDDHDPHHPDPWTMVVAFLDQIDADANAKDEPVATWHWRLLHEDHFF